MRRLIKDKKGFAQLVPLILAVGIAIIVLGIVASLAANTRTSLSDVSIGNNTDALYKVPSECGGGCGTGSCNWTCTSHVYNITDAGLGALVTLSGYWGIIITIGIFVIILGALMTMFQGGKRR